MSELQILWKEIIQKKYPGKIKQSVLIRWKYVDESVVQFLKYKNYFIKFAETIKTSIKLFIQDVT